MKIGISTFHFAPNSGAMLQCFALQKKLESMGHEVIILDYRPTYHTNRYIPLRNPFIECNNIIEFAKNIYYNRNCIRRLIRNNKFKNFEKHYHHLSPLFIYANEYCEVDLEAIICGSDQIWNTKITNNDFDDVYFANVPNFTGKKIAYGASIGETNIEDNAEKFEILLDDFDFISMRESLSAKKLQYAIGKKVYTVPDPTLLLKKDDYDELLTRIKISGKYILVYYFGKNTILQSVISNIKNKFHLPIVSISPYRIPIKENYKTINNIGPAEFLSYINGADLIVTNSFHCSVFSMIFKKKFITISNGKRNERLENLFNSLNTGITIIKDESDINDVIDYNYDYTDLDYDLEKQRLIGEQFLKTALGE